MKTLLFHFACLFLLCVSASAADELPSLKANSDGTVTVNEAELVNLINSSSVKIEASTAQLRLAEEALKSASLEVSSSKSALNKESGRRQALQSRLRQSNASIAAAQSSINESRKLQEATLVDLREAKGQLGAAQQQNWALQSQMEHDRKRAWIPFPVNLLFR